MSENHFITLAEGLPRAPNWEQYDYFDYLTKPELRPHDPSEERVFFKTLMSTWGRLLRLSVLKGINKPRQLELAALVSDFREKCEMFEGIQKQVKELQQVPDLLGARTLSAIRKAAEILKPIADGLPEEHAFASGRRLKELVNALEGVPRQWTAATAQELRTLVRSMRQDHPQAGDPMPLATWQLFWFLVERCGLARNEAELRVARIGMKFFQWKKLRYRDRYEGADDWKGCAAIKERIARFEKRILAKNDTGKGKEPSSSTPTKSP